MATPEEIKRKVDALARRVEAVRRKKAELAALLRAKKAELASFVQDIKAAGVDLRGIGTERDIAKRDLEAMIASYERDLVGTEQALQAPVGTREHPASEPGPDQGMRDALDMASATTAARLVIGYLKTVLERGDDGEALRLVRQLVGLVDPEPQPVTTSDRPSPLPRTSPRSR